MGFNMNINWFPGHMKKTIEEIENKQKLVDFVIEVVDARIPRSSRNPLFNEIIKKPRLIILNKEDLASPSENKAWVEAIDKTNDRAILYNSNSGNPSVIVKESKILMKDFIERQKEKGISTGALRAMIVGIPNSGKSTFINNVSKRRATKVGNRPGVTKTNQWIRINDDLHLLDTPGVLWHKLDKEAQLHLAWTGAIKDEIMDIETLAFEFIKYTLKLNKTILENRYKIEATDDPLEVMESIARKRGAILRGAEVDYNKVSSIILDEFRKGILGRITLEKND